MRLRSLAEFSVDALKELAAPRSWDRGESYYQNGAVVELLQYDRTLVATVKGSEAYEVRIFLRPRGAIGWECSCPWSTDTGDFCKHCVAVGLAYIRGRAEGTEWGDPTGPLLAVREWLGGQSKGELAALIMEQALKFEPLRTELLHQSGQPSRCAEEADDDDDEPDW